MTSYTPAVLLGPGDATSALWEGFVRGLGDPVLRKKILLALAVNAVVFTLMVGLMLWGAFAYIDGFMGPEGVAADAGWWASMWSGLKETIRWLLQAAVVIGVFFVAPVLFTLLAAVVLPIFQGGVFLAARKSAAGPPVAGAPSLVEAAVSIAATEVRRLLRFVALSLAALLLNLIPVIGSVLYVAAQFMLSANALGWDLLSHHFELHGLKYGDQKAFIKRHRSMVLGLGSGALALCLVPIAQILFITTNVAGAGILSAWMDGAPRSG